MKTKHAFTLTGSILASLLAMPAHAEFFEDADPAPGNQPGSIYVPVTPPTGANQFSEGWEKLTAALYPDVNVGFPGSDDWEDVMPSQVGGKAGFNSLLKTDDGDGGFGGPYPATSSIYYGGMSSATNLDGGKLTIDVSGSGLLSGVQTVVFQIDIGEAWTYDLHNGAAPVLHYTTATTSGTATLSFQSLYKEVYNGTVTMPSGEEDVHINSRAYQFDLSGLGAITSFSISFRGVQHAQLYGVGLQQFDAASSSTSLIPADVND